MKEISPEVILGTIKRLEDPDDGRLVQRSLEPSNLRNTVLVRLDVRLLRCGWRLPCETRPVGTAI
jgi:hypothetical protein